MVFSRYVKVLRCAGNFLRMRNFDSKVNPTVERNFSKTTFIFRAGSVQEKPQDFVESSEKSSGSSTNLDDETNSKDASNFLELTSQASTTFDSTVAEENPSDNFGNELFISDDKSKRNNIAEKNDDSSENSISENDILERPKGPLDACDEDLSHITPYHKPTFNFAAYADKSETIQELAKLGVELYKLETHPDKMKLILQRNFSDMKPYIRFLHDSGVPADNIGAFITKNPFIFNEDIDDLHTRIRYLRAHKFDVPMIARVVSQNPYWLLYNTKEIDARLGYFQYEFSLNGSKVRYLATKQPRLITYNQKRVRENTFAVREEMGFNKLETTSILLAQPRIFMKTRRHIVEVFDYAHNTMKLPHEIICSKPQLLTCRLHRLKNRHQYLETLGKNQYDPTQPLYVSPEAIISGSDVEFCLNVAKTTVETYNLFLKTI